MQKTLLVCLLVGLFLLATIFFPVPVHAQVGVSPNSLDFGSVVLNAKSSAATVVVTNQSGSYDAILRISSSLPEFVVTGPALPIALAPFGSASFQVISAPDSERSFSGSVVFSSRRTNDSSSSIAASGIGIIPPTHLVSASPIGLNFGSSLVEYPVAETIVLTNTGTASVTLSQATVAGVGFLVSGLSGSVTLAAGQGMNLTVTFAPRTAASATGSLAVTSTATNSPTVISLSGTGVQPQISVSPASANFGSLIASASNTQVLTIGNPGTANLVVTQASLAGAGFNITGLELPLTIPPGGSSRIAMVFAPTSAGRPSGSLTLVSSAPGPPLVVSLAGAGVASVLQLTASPTSLNFGSLATGTSATQNVTLTNTGNSSVTISQISARGAGFTTSGDALPFTLAAGESSTLTASFAPAIGGSGSVTVTSTATNSPAMILLSGAGVRPQISVIPASVSFGNVTVGVTNTQMLTIRNTGTANLSVTQASLSGTGFSVSGLTLPLALSPGGTSTFTLGFAPASAGNLTGSLTLSSNAPSSPLDVPLAGTGIPCVLQLTPSPASLNFGSLTTGTSATQSVTLTNTGNSSVTISQISASGAGFTVNSVALPFTLAAGQSSTFTAAFAPATTGALSGAVTVSSTATNSPQIIALSGTGTAPVTHTVELTWTASSSTYSGFNVYRALTIGGPYAKVNASLIAATYYVDTSVASKQTYYYVATEVDTSGTESSYSSEVSAAIP